MMKVEMKIKETEVLIASDVSKAKSMKERMLGLMFSEDIPRGDALWIKPCNSIHTFFMKYPIDVLFLDRNLTVVKIYENLAPWRITPIHFKSSSVVEMRGGSLKGTVKVGEHIEVNDV